MVAGVTTRGHPFLLAAAVLLWPACASAQGLARADHWQISAVALLAAAWLAFAVWAVIRGARARAQAQIAQAWGMRLRGLLTTAPGAYLVVGSDGAASCSDMLRAWLDLDQKVARLDDLAPMGVRGIEAEDFRALSADIAALAVSGTSFARLVRTAGTGRTLLAQGSTAPPEVAGERGVVVWFADSTEAQAAVETLRSETRELAEVLNATTALIEAAPFPIWRRGDDLKLRHVNSAYVRAVEAGSAGDVVAQGLELVNTARATPPEHAARRARELRQPQNREETVIIGGARRTLQIVDVPMGSAGVGGFALDVTEREEARASLARFERAQRETLDRLSSGVALFGADQGLAFFNKAFATLFQLDPEWLDDRPEFGRVLERMREARRLPEQRDFPTWRRERRAWFTDALGPIEETWALPDNTIVRVIAQPHPDGGLLLVFEDHSERLRLASSRDTVLRVQEATLNNLHEAVGVFGADGRIQLSNTRFAALIELTPELTATKPHVDELVELMAHQLAEPEQAQALRDIVRTATAGRQQRQGRFHMLDGRVLDYAAVPLPDGNALFTFLDVTDTARIETALRDRNEALEAADKLKSAFVANISYELRTPLTAIIGFAEMLAQGYWGSLNERQADYVGSILTSSERLQLLINDILDLAIHEAGELALDLTSVAVAPMIESVVAMAREQATSRGLKIGVEIDPSAGSLDGDERRLKQVLHNLLTNAIRFTTVGGRIDVQAHGTSREVILIVSDTGVGIHEDEQVVVFERFRKGSNAGSNQGVGLGLALVRQFVDLHGGSVELESQLGEGTTVTVRLPRHHAVMHAAQ